MSTIKHCALVPSYKVQTERMVIQITAKNAEFRLKVYLILLQNIYQF